MLYGCVRSSPTTGMEMETARRRGFLRHGLRHGDIMAQHFRGIMWYNIINYLLYELAIDQITRKEG
jgi:hypothetical protein